MNRSAWCAMSPSRKRLLAKSRLFWLTRIAHGERYPKRLLHLLLFPWKRRRPPRSSPRQSRGRCWGFLLSSRTFSANLSARKPRFPWVRKKSWKSLLRLVRTTALSCWKHCAPSMRHICFKDCSRTKMPMFLTKPATVFLQA